MFAKLCDPKASHKIQARFRKKDNFKEARFATPLKFFGHFQLIVLKPELIPKSISKTVQVARTLSALDIDMCCDCYKEFLQGNKSTQGCQIVSLRYCSGQNDEEYTLKYSHSDGAKIKDKFRQPHAHTDIQTYILST